MIDPAAFARVMGGFADKIGRALAPETSAMYYDVLSESLTTDEFLAGARIVFRNHSYNTWPAPHQFIDAVKPKDAPALAASDVFERLLGSQHPERIALGIGPAALRAFRATGGKREFTAVLEQDVKWLRQRFVENYEHAVKAFDAGADAHRALEAVSPKVAAIIANVAELRDIKHAKKLPVDHKLIAAGERE